MKKSKILFSFEKRNGALEKVLPFLRDNLKEYEILYHNPKKEGLALDNLIEKYSNYDLFVIKVAAECSIDLLHFANLHNITTVHNLNPVLICKNKVALDHHLRKILSNTELGNNFKLSASWTRSLLEKEKFKSWVKERFPVVLKSHYQHNEYIRFNYLVRNMQEVEDFYETYKEFLYYDVYIQDFIECDGIDRKIYVIGDKVFGIKRRNPIYIFLKENVEFLDVEKLEREEYEPSPQIQKLALTLAKELELCLFGFDLIKTKDKEEYYLIDLNSFPGFRGIENNIQHLVEFFINFIQNR
ncbi:MAG: ATP-grasp domain-containing protein [Promethearchaeia archaeon]